MSHTHNIFVPRRTLELELFSDEGPSECILSLFEAALEKNPEITLSFSSEDKEEINASLRKLTQASATQQKPGSDRLIGDIYKFTLENFNEKFAYVPVKSTRGLYLNSRCIISTEANHKELNAALESVLKERHTEEQARRKFLKALGQNASDSTFESEEKDSKVESDRPKVVTLKNFINDTLPFLRNPYRSTDEEFEHSNETNSVFQALGYLFSRDPLDNVYSALQLLILVTLVYLKGRITEQESSNAIALYKERYSASADDGSNNPLSYAKTLLAELRTRANGLTDYTKKLLAIIRRLNQRSPFDTVNSFLGRSFNQEDFLSIVTGILILLEIFKEGLLDTPNENHLNNIQHTEDVQANNLVQTIDSESISSIAALDYFETVRSLAPSVFFTLIEESLQEENGLTRQQEEPSYTSITPVNPDPHTVPVISEEPTAPAIPALVISEEPTAPAIPALVIPEEPTAPAIPALVIPEEPVDPIIPEELTPPVIPEKPTPSITPAPVITEEPIDPDNTLYGDGDANFISGSDSNDRIIGDAGDDTLLGKAGDDHLIGGSGDDLLQGGTGADTLDGGSGSDIASYADADSSVEIDLLTGARFGAAADDTFISIEGIEATQYNDVVRGDENNNIISGLEGDDVLTGRDGNDQIDGGEGVDQINGGNDNDTLSGGIGDDEIFGGDGNDLIRGDLNRADTQDEVIGGNDILHGGKGNDRIGGKTGDDQIFGNEGNDELFGGLGNDLLDGGPDRDILTGLSDADIFRMSFLTEGVDTITDFSQQENDSLHISRQGFSEELALGELSPDAFALGTVATNPNTRFIYDQQSGSLLFDPDGTGSKAATEVVIFSNNIGLGHSDISII